MVIFTIELNFYEFRSLNTITEVKKNVLSNSYMMQSLIHVSLIILVSNQQILPWFRKHDRKPNAYVCKA